MTFPAENNITLTGGLCMKGGIYATDRCPICGGIFKDTGKGLFCPAHPKIQSSKFAVKFGNIFKRFRDYDAASRFLTGLRFKTDEKTFDERDYQRANPLGFINAPDKWLEYKTTLKSYKDTANHIRKAQDYFGHFSVKEIRYGHLEDFLKQLTCKDKTKANTLSAIHSFYTWMKKRQMIAEMPEFPVVNYELGWRRTVDKETQNKVIEEIGRIAPLKVYLGVKWLSKYISIRPAEMIKLKEGEIDLSNKYFYVPHPKEKKFKSVPILDEDAAIIRQIGLSFPAMPFFRHEGGIKGTRSNQPYGLKYLYKWAKKAMDNLGIKGVDLYGLTMHSSTRALSQYRTPEEIKKAIMRSTSKAAERYFGLADDKMIRDVYSDTDNVIPIDTKLILKKGTGQNDK